MKNYYSNSFTKQYSRHIYSWTSTKASSIRKTKGKRAKYSSTGMLHKATFTMVTIIVIIIIIIIIIIMNKIMIVRIIINS